MINCISFSRFISRVCMRQGKWWWWVWCFVFCGARAKRGQRAPARVNDRRKSHTKNIMPLLRRNTLTFGAQQSKTQWDTLKRFAQTSAVFFFSSSNSCRRGQLKCDDCKGQHSLVGYIELTPYLHKVAPHPEESHDTGFPWPYRCLANSTNSLLWVVWAQIYARQIISRCRIRGTIFLWKVARCINSTINK